MAWRQWRHRPARWLLPLGALALAGVLVLTWMNALAAEAGRAALQPAGDYDFSVTKLAFPSRFDPNLDNNIYQFVIAANGYQGGEAHTIYVVDDLPAGVTWTPADDNPYWDCVPASTPTRIFCFYQDVFTNTFRSLRVNVQIDDGVAANILANTVRVTTIPEDQNPANNTSTITTIATDNLVDLALQKSVTPASINTGTITYTLAYSNVGSTPAEPFTVIDQLPLGLEFQEATYGIIPIGNTLTWALPALAPGTGGTLRVTMTVGPEDNGGQFENTASLVINPEQVDIQPGNNSASVTIYPGSLNIVKTATLPNDGAFVRAGQVFSYTLLVEPPTSGNFGGLIISDTLDARLEYLGSRVVSGGGTINPATNRTLRYMYPGVFDSSADAPIELEIGVRPMTVVSQQLVPNIATLSWMAGDDRVSVHSDPAIVTVEPGELERTLTITPIHAQAGDIMTFHIRVRNLTGQSITNLRITDTISTSLMSLMSAGSTSGTVTRDNQTGEVNVTLSSLTPGNAIEVLINAQVRGDAPLGMYTNQARITYNGSELLTNDVPFWIGAEGVDWSDNPIFCPLMLVTP